MADDLRCTIDNELNRIVVTKSEQEILDMIEFLKINIRKYADINILRIRSEK